MQTKAVGRGTSQVIIVQHLSIQPNAKTHTYKTVSVLHDHIDEDIHLTVLCFLLVLINNQRRRPAHQLCTLPVTLYSH